MTESCNGIVQLSILGVVLVFHLVCQSLSGSQGVGCFSSHIRQCIGSRVRFMSQKVKCVYEEVKRRLLFWKLLVAKPVTHMDLLDIL